MNKKITSLLFLLLLPVSVLAGGVQEPVNKVVPMSTRGEYEYYIGFGLGSSIASYDVTDNTIVSQSNVAATVYQFAPDTQTVSTNSFLINLFFGVGRNFNKLYAGAEISGDLSTNRSANNINRYNQTNNTPLRETFVSNNSYKLRTFVFNLDVLPGVYIAENSLLYARIGLAVASLTITINTSFNTLAGLNSPLSLSTNKTKAGLRVGLGLKQRVSQRWYFGLSYVAAIYAHHTITQTGDFTAGAGSSSATARSNAVTQTMLASASYHFHI